MLNNANSAEIFFEIKNDGGLSKVEVPNGFAAAQGAFQHICTVITAAGEGRVYRQGGYCMRICVHMHWQFFTLGRWHTGMQVGLNADFGVPKNGVRNTCIVARANDNSANLDGALDDFRVYDRALSEAEVGGLPCGGWMDSSTTSQHFASLHVLTPFILQVQDILCMGRPALDCVGLLGHYPLDGDVRDASSNAWHGDIVASTAEVGRLVSTRGACMPERRLNTGHACVLCSRLQPWPHLPVAKAFGDFFTNESAVGSHAVRFQGQDGHIRLPGRQFGGALSVSVWVKVVTAQRYA